MTKLEQIQASPATYAFTSRCDARHLATLAALWQSMGEHPRSISELVRLSVETLSEMMVLSGKIDFIPSQSEAQEILGSLGLLGKGILRRNLVEAIVKEGGSEIPHTRVIKNPSQSISKDDPHFKRAQDLLAKELLSSLNKPLINDRAELEDTLSALGRIPE